MPSELTALHKDELSVAAELRSLDPDILRRLLPDISVSVAPYPETSCNHVTFTVTLQPGLVSRPTGSRFVKVRIMDKMSGVSTTVGEVLLLVPAAGGSTTASIEWPMPEDAAFTPDWLNEITVIADPDHAILERNEGNNIVAVDGQCVG